MTAASLILMELFVTIAFLVTLWMTGGSKISLLILAQVPFSVLGGGGGGVRIAERILAP
jgi:hypothetical protein